MRRVHLDLGPTRFDITHRAVVMGILNRTPDSFFDQGEFWDLDAFYRRAERLVADGADFLDVGGVKAGPGDFVGEDEELERVVPAVEACLLYTSPSPRDGLLSRMPSSA